MQLGIFDIPQNKTPQQYNISGLQYIPDFISMQEEEILIKFINDGNWLKDLKRRVQHYGYKYDYRSKRIDPSMQIGGLPEWTWFLSLIWFDKDVFNVTPDQLIVNEYLAGQGIGAHVDCEPCFGETIASLSLGSSCVMDFVNLKSKEKAEVLLEPRSLIILNGEARHDWTHGIAARKEDVFNGAKFERGTRYSMTFRNVIIS